VCSFLILKMKKLFNIIIIFLLFTSSIFAADEIEKGKILLKSLSKKSLTKKETISFLNEYAVIIEDERGDGEVTYVFDDDKYSRYKGTEIISTDAWRFSKLGALRLFNTDVKMTWKIKIGDKENLINIKTKFDPVGKLYGFEVKTKKEFLNQIEQIKQVEIQKKEAIEKAKIKKKKKLKQEKLTAEKKRKEEEEKLKEDKRKLEEEKLALQKELEELKKKKAEELEQAKKTPKQIKKEENERLKQEKLAAKKKAKEERERLKQEKLEAQKKAKAKAKKKAEEEKLKAKKKKLFDSVIKAKWGFKGIPCDMNGGSYEMYVPGKGFMMWSGGKIQDGGGATKIVSNINQISETEFVVTTKMYPTPLNKLMYGAIGDRMTAETVRTFKIVNVDSLRFRNDITMIDMNAVLAGKRGNQVGYTYKTENSERARCK